MKTFKNIFSLAILASAFVACEDIPLPYEIHLEEETPETSIYYESLSHNTGWTTQPANGKDNPWSQGSSYTQATGSQKWDGSNRSYRETEGFLISPRFNTVAESGKVKFSVEYGVGYTSSSTGDSNYQDHIAIYVSKTYTQGTINLEEWTKLDWKATHTVANWDLPLAVAQIQLPAEFVNEENVHIAYWFYSPATKSCTFEVKKFVIEEGVAGEDSDTPDTGVNGVPYTSASLQEGWKVWTAAGKIQPWSQGGNYTQATGYQKWEGDTKSNREVDGYLISPAFNTTVASGKVKMSFENCVAYATNDPDYAKHVKLYVSKSADGTNFNASEWEELKWTATHETTNWTLATDEVQLPEAYVNQENVHVAFWFYAPADKSSTFELKNFKLEEGTAGEPTTETGGGNEQANAGEGVTISGTTVVATNSNATASEDYIIVDFSAQGFENEKTVTTVEAEGCTITFAKADGTTDPKFYTATKGVRVYAKNTITFAGTQKPIAKVEMTCDNYNGTNYVGNTTAFAAGSGNSLVYTNDHTEAKGGVQLRVQKAKIYFAK